MLLLTSTSDLVQLVTSAAGDIEAHASWVDNASGTITPGRTNTASIVTAATTTVVGSPAASTQRNLQTLSARNNHATISNTVTFQHTDGTNVETLLQCTLSPGDAIIFMDGVGWKVYDSNGRQKIAPVDRTGYTGRPQTFHKSGTAADAVGYWYCTAKDSGFPGAWAPGTPGLAGRATDGTAVADAGCVPFQNPSTGGIYLTAAALWSSTVHPHTFFDCLWVNSGIAVTTTTAQTINSVAFPARDVNGSTNGEGLEIGLLTTTANTNAAVNNTATVSYTNSEGTAGRTATLEAVVGMQIPATPVIGNLVWFKLAAGDKGVRSIQTITLGTSLGAGAVSLIVARKMPPIACTVSGGAAEMQGIENPGIRLYNGTCMLHCYRASATTATVVGGSLTQMER